MTTKTNPFNVTRKQLPQYLASLDDLPEDTVIYKRFQDIDDSTPTWYVEKEDPYIDRRYDLADQYGGVWYRYDSLYRITNEETERAAFW